MTSTHEKGSSGTPSHVSESLAPSDTTSHVSESVSPTSPSQLVEHEQSTTSKVLHLLDEGAVEKDLHIAEYVVSALLNDKKRALNTAIEEEFAATPPDKRARMLDCGCGCKAKPCNVRLDRKFRYKQHLAHKIWPALEKSFVRDLAWTICQTKKRQRWFADELAKLSQDNAILRQKLAVVASAF